MLENSKPNEDGPSQWILKKVDWERYQNKKRLIQDSNNKIPKYFTETLLAIATECIPKKTKTSN